MTWALTCERAVVSASEGRQPLIRVQRACQPTLISARSSPCAGSFTPHLGLRVHGLRGRPIHAARHGHLVVVALLGRKCLALERELRLVEFLEQGRGGGGVGVIAALAVEGAALDARGDRDGLRDGDFDGACRSTAPDAATQAPVVSNEEYLLLR